MVQDGAAAVVRPNRAVRTLLLTRERITAFTLDDVTGSHHVLAPGPSAVWALLDDALTVDELTSELADTLGLSASEAAAVVDDALFQFEELGLLQSDADEGFARTGADRDDREREPVTALPRGPDP